jgi:hypothetical protein
MYEVISFIKGALFPNFKNIVERELLTVGVQQLEDIFSIVRDSMGACVWDKTT